MQDAELAALTSPPRIVVNDGCRDATGSPKWGRPLGEADDVDTRERLLREALAALREARP